MRVINRAVVALLSVCLLVVLLGQVIPPPGEVGAQALPPAPTIAAAPLPSPAPDAGLPLAVVPIQPPAVVAAVPVSLPPAVAPPVEPEPSLVAQALSYLLPLLASILSALAIWVLGLLGRRFRVALDLEQGSKLRGAVRAAIFGSEEWAARQAKVAGGPPPAGPLKASWATEALRRQYPAVLPADLALLLDEELGGMPGYGASSAPKVRK